MPEEELDREGLPGLTHKGHLPKTGTQPVLWRGELLGLVCIFVSLPRVLCLMLEQKNVLLSITYMILFR